MCEVVADEYGCTVSETSIPIFTQSGDDRYSNAGQDDHQGAQVLPHGLINNVKEKLGLQGEAGRLRGLAPGAGACQTAGPPNGMPVSTLMCTAPSAPSTETTTTPLWPTIWPSWRSWPNPLHLRIEGPMDCDCDRETQWRPWPASPQNWTAGHSGSGAGSRRMVQHPEDIKLFADHKAGHMVQIKTLTWAASTIPSRPSYTARKRASAPIRAEPATRPTAALRSVCSAPWQPSRIRS